MRVTKSADHMLLVRRGPEGYWNVGAFTGLSFARGTSQEEVLARCSEEGWTLVTSVPGADGAITLFLRIASETVAAEQR